MIDVDNRGGFILFFNVHELVFISKLEVKLLVKQMSKKECSAAP